MIFEPIIVLSYNLTPGKSNKIVHTEYHARLATNAKDIRNYMLDEFQYYMKNSTDGCPIQRA